jgi:hypothetical protein
MFLAFALALAGLLVLGVWLLILSGEREFERARRRRMGLPYLGHAPRRQDRPDRPG